MHTSAGISRASAGRGCAGQAAGPGTAAAETRAASIAVEIEISPLCRITVAWRDYNSAMAVLSRRDFGRALVGVPAVSVLGAIRLDGAMPLAIGVTTSSFSDLPRI